jgi:HSP20 family protein
MTKTANIEGPRSLTSQVRHHPLVTLRDEMDDLLSRFFGGQDGWFSGRMFLFADVAETDTAFEVTLDLPGVDAEKLDVHVSGNVLTVRGERPDTKVNDGRISHRVERRKGAFSRSVTLPSAVVDDEVVAEYKDGVLTITLPKCEEARSRTIAVKH